MDAGGFSANAIQNSVRELNLLDEILSGCPPEKNYAFNFGTIESGYTGSTFEGLLVAGVLERLKYPGTRHYGADADHIQVKRGDANLQHAKRLLSASRYYSFYTLDMSDVLVYAALDPQSLSGKACLESKVPGAKLRKAVVNYHTAEHRVGGQTYRLCRELVERLVAKYWDAMEALETLTGYLTALKAGRPFDLELSIDEHPPEVSTFDCLTTAEELLFVLREMQRRGLPVTHVAPNFGVEKGHDYHGHDGLAGLGNRIRQLVPIAEEYGVLMDFHSGDDLSSATRGVIHRATAGKLHFKISPSLQILFAEVLEDYYPELFRRWWQDAFTYASREAGAGSSLAIECLHDYETSDRKAPAHDHSIFHHYSFAFVGRRDPSGQFLYRDEFYNLSDEFCREYQDRVAGHLCRLADELF
jgi:hypothetical protein